jgi:phosphatidylglycerol---prolipoprotein diacylglyceryl transferase
VFPVILEIGGIPIITSFGLMMFLSFLTGAWVTGVQLQRYGIPQHWAWDLLAWCAIGGIVGAKLYHIVLHWQELLVNPRDLILNRAGLVWYGGLIGGIVAYYLQIRTRKLPAATMFDATAPALAIAYAVGRTGCFLVGDDYGRYTEGRFGVAFSQRHSGKHRGISP